jgi:outer membrane protein
MIELRPSLALFLSALMIAPAGMAQEPPPSTPPPTVKPAPAWTAQVYSDKPQVPTASGSGWYNSLTRPYRQPVIGPINLRDSNRLDSLLRAGKLYLSLQDAIALALENNLDIDLSRYGPEVAQADYLRAKAGGLLRGVPTTVTQGPTSALTQAGLTTGIGGTSGAPGTSGATGGVGGTVITQTGVAIPFLDPQLFFATNYSHLSRPQSNTITTGGLTAIALDNKTWNLGYQQAFLTGTTISYGWNNSYTSSNNPFNDLNPNTTVNMQLQFTQHILQGFGIAVNNRNIRVAKNDLRVSDLTFVLQVMTTVSSVVNLYWDLVSLNETYKVRLKALEVAQKFYSDNKKQVEIGTLAPIEIVRADANVATAQQNLTTAETQLLQQETIIKSALSRTGTASPAVAAARIIPTDPLRMQVDEQLPSSGDLVNTALARRPDLEQNRIQVENSKIALAGSRSSLLPTLDVTGYMQHNALTGDVNTIVGPGGVQPPHNADPYFIGGYGNALGQVFRRNFPDYSIGFQLIVPIRNRTAQADYIRDQVTLRQQEVSSQKAINNARVDVQNALIGVIQARAGYQSAVKARILQEQTLDAENKKYQLGASTAFIVVQTQRDLAQAQSDEVTALATYSRARVQLSLSTADVLDVYNVSIDEAKRGQVARLPSIIPAQP